MRVLCSCLVALALVPSCRKDQPQQPVEVAPEAQKFSAFWSWITAHLQELKAIETGREPIAEQLTAELQKVDPELVFELGLGKVPFEVIISADGHERLFPLVKRMVAAAPKLPGAVAIAFRPRKDAGMKLTVQGVTVAGPDLRFVALKDTHRPGRIGLVVWVHGMTPENEESAKGATFLLLEAVLGEYDLETRIGGIDMRPEPSDVPAEAKPLAELTAVVDGWGK